MIFFAYWHGKDLLNWPKDRWAVLLSPRMKWCSLLDNGIIWAGDNDAFTGNFCEKKWKSWIISTCRKYKNTCKFIAVPDVVGDCDKTIENYKLYHGLVRENGLPLAFVAQDGQESRDLPDDYDALFIGGTTEWKMSKGAGECIKRAKSNGKWVHIGRVNSQKRIHHFNVLGADSCDGTTISRGPRINMRRMDIALRQDVLFQS